jgi:hypothetical protein
MNDNIRTRESKRFINEYGYSRDFYLRNFGSGEDVVLEKPVKIRNFNLLINEFEAQPEDFKNKTIRMHGTPRPTLQDNYSNGFALLRHVISQMMADAGICAKFNYTVDPIRGRHSNLEHVNYYSTPLDKYIECDFSEFMASTASKWHKKETLDIFMYYYTKGKRCMQEDLKLRYEDIISFLKIVYETTK